MSAVTETTLFIFGLIALGYVAGVTGYLQQNLLWGVYPGEQVE